MSTIAFTDTERLDFLSSLTHKRRSDIVRAYTTAKKRKIQTYREAVDSAMAKVSLASKEPK